MSMMVEEQAPRAEATDRRLEQMHRIIASQSFAKAPRLCSFLSYIVERSIEGDVDSLTEQQIGIHVFNRSPGYNSNDDNIVRGTARSLRQRLATYYLTEGTRDALRIDIPKGAYVAQFSQVAVDPEFAEKSFPLRLHPELVPALASAPAKSDRRWAAWAGWVAAVVMAGVMLWPTLHAHFSPQEPSALLWSTIFSKDRPTYIVPGDAGLNMYEVLEGRTVDLNDYSQQNYRGEDNGTPSIGQTLGTRFYTTMSDLQLVAKLVKLPQADSDRVHVRFARDLAASDLKDANLVLTGTRSYDPWTELFQSGLSLRMSWDVKQDLFTVINLAPLPGEQKIYQWTVKNGVRGGLTLVSLTDNTQGSGRVLLIEGTTMAGVYAGADFLSNKRMLGNLIKQARRPDGSLRNFDVLLQSDFVREGVSNLHVLAEHVR